MLLMILIVIILIPTPTRKMAAGVEAEEAKKAER
jgi:hypothetical protein